MPVLEIARELVIRAWIDKGRNPFLAGVCRVLGQEGQS